MSRITAALVTLAAVGTLSTGCAAMGTKRSTQNSSQIQRTAEPADTIDSGATEGRPELGQR
jgi:hypothetical protein